MNIFWSKDGEIVENGSEDMEIFVLESASFEDAGHYQCHFQSRMENKTSTSSIINVYSPMNVTQTPNNMKLTQRGTKRMKIPACKSCDGCRALDCGTCKMCLDKPKFGGKNTIRQKCVLKVCSVQEEERKKMRPDLVAGTNKRRYSRSSLNSTSNDASDSV